jgi:hypothetical protein
MNTGIIDTTVYVYDMLLFSAEQRLAIASAIHCACRMRTPLFHSFDRLLGLSLYD